MPVGVPDTEVFAAADRVLARGERPTVERVRVELGRGSPARVGQLLEIWWDALAKRLARHAALPGLPDAVAGAFAQVWELAVNAGRTAAEQEVAAERAALATVMQALHDESAQQATALAQAQSEAADARAAAELGGQRLADLERLLAQQAQELGDVRAQRDAAQARAAQHEASVAELRAELAARLTEAQAERAGWGAQIQAMEDRAHREIDRARQELKETKLQAATAGKAAQRREQALQQELDKGGRTITTLEGKLTALTAKALTRSRSGAKKPAPAKRVGAKTR